jgi:hypothetical protein
LSTAGEKPESAESVVLKDPGLSAFLAWLVPGLGHLYQGRMAKAVLYFVCIMGLFTYGLYLGSDAQKGYYGRVVYFSWEPGHKRLPYLCQIGAGLVAMPALIQSYRMADNNPVWWRGFMAPPRLGPAQGRNIDQPTADQLYLDLNRYFELGTVFTMIAGLLNILAIYDAWGGPVFLETGKKEEGDGQEGEKDKQDEKSGKTGKGETQEGDSGGAGKEKHSDEPTAAAH